MPFQNHAKYRQQNPVSLEKSLLLLPPVLAEQIYIEVNASRTSEIIPEFELEHNGTKILSVRKVTLW